MQGRGEYVGDRFQLAPDRALRTIAVITAVISVSPALAQQQTQTLTVMLTELQFNSKTITLTVGQPVQRNIQNKGLADHNLASRDESDSIPISNVTYQKADNDPRQLRMYEADNILDTDVNSGHASVVTLYAYKGWHIQVYQQCR